MRIEISLTTETSGFTFTDPLTESASTPIPESDSAPRPTLSTSHLVRTRSLPASSHVVARSAPGTGAPVSSKEYFRRKLAAHKALTGETSKDVAKRLGVGPNFLSMLTGHEYASTVSLDRVGDYAAAVSTIDKYEMTCILMDERVPQAAQAIAEMIEAVEPPPGYRQLRSAVEDERARIGQYCDLPDANDPRMQAAIHDFVQRLAEIEKADARY